MFEDDKEKVSYCIGLEIGRSLKDQFQGMEIDKLLLGIEHFLRNEEFLLEKTEIEHTLKSFQQQMMAQEQKMLEGLAEQNKRQGDAFLEENKRKTNITTLPSGLQYEVLVKGSGAVPRAVDVVTTHYRGMLLDGTIFDSSYDRAQAATFPVNRVIPGWIEALQLMKVGDKWRLYIPPELAYGEQGAPPHIGPNATLIFDIELLGIN